MNIQLYNKILSATQPQNIDTAVQFIKNIQTYKLDARTVDAVLKLVTNSFDISTLHKLEFAGTIYDESKSDGTGQHIHLGFKLRNKENQKTITLGMDTGLKFVEVARVSNLASFPELKLQTISDSEYENLNTNIEKEYAKSLEEILSKKKSIQDVQKKTERKQVQGILDLDNTIERLEDLFAKGLREKIIQQPLDFLTQYQDINYAKGNWLTQLEQYVKVLNPELKKDYFTLLKYKNILSKEEYIEKMSRLKQEFDTLIPLPLSNTILTYVQDLKHIATDTRWNIPTKQTIQLLQELESQHTKMSTLGFKALFFAFDLEEKRKIYAQEYITEHEKRKQEYGIGSANANKLFVKDNTFIGNKTKSVPKKITEQLQQIVKKGDKTLQQIQEHERNKYISKHKEEQVFAQNSISKNQEIIDAYILFARKLLIKDSLDSEFSKEKPDYKKIKWLTVEQLNNNKFVLTEHSSFNDLNLDELIARIEGLNAMQTNLFSNPIEPATYQKLKFAQKTGLLNNEVYMHILQNPAYESICSMQEINPTIKRLLTYSKILENHPAIIKAENIPYIDRTKKWFTPKEIEKLYVLDELLSKIGMQSRWNNAKNQIEKFNTIQQQRRGKPRHKIMQNTSSETQIKGWLSEYKPDENYVTTHKPTKTIYIPFQQKENIMFEMDSLIPVTTEILTQATSLPKNIINENTQKTFQYYIKPHTTFEGDFIEKSLVDRIQAEYQNT